MHLASSSFPCGAGGLAAKRTSKPAVRVAVSPGKVFQFFVNEFELEEGPGPRRQAAAVSDEAPALPDPEVPPPPTTTCTAIQKASAMVTFEIRHAVNYGQHVAIVGEGDQMGDWDPQSRIPMEWNEGDVWTAAAPMVHDADSCLTYKYVVCNDDGHLLDWMPGDNVKLALPDGAIEIAVSNVWSADMRAERSSAKVTRWAERRKGEFKSSTRVHVGELTSALKSHHRTMREAADPTSLEAILADRKLAEAWHNTVQELRREDALTLALSSGEPPIGSSPLESRASLEPSSSLRQRAASSTPSASGGAHVILSVPFSCKFGHHLAVVGSGPLLGDWSVERHLSMKWTEGDIWTVDIRVDPGCPHLEYKYVVCDGNGQIIQWQPGQNRQIRVPPGLASDPNFTMELCEQFERPQLATPSKHAPQRQRKVFTT